MHGERIKTAQHVLGHPHAHHQELINCSIVLYVLTFYLNAVRFLTVTWKYDTSNDS